jgi:hypothetical protein
MSTSGKSIIASCKRHAPFAQRSKPAHVLAFAVRTGANSATEMAKVDQRNVPPVVS